MKWGNDQTNRHTRNPQVLELMYKHHRNVSRRFQKDISSRTKDIKRSSQLMTHTHMDRQTHKCKSRADPTRDGLANKGSIMMFLHLSECTNSKYALFTIYMIKSKEKSIYIKVSLFYGWYIAFSEHITHFWICYKANH